MSAQETPQSRTIETHGLRLHYLDWGGDGLQPMLLLHGLQDSARLWDFFAANLRQSYRVMALDHRGHGDSPWAPPEAYKLADYVEELTQVIEALDLRDLVLIGHSAGAKNAFIYAAQRPQRLSKLVIVDMDPDQQNPGSAQMLTRYRAESDVYPDLDAVVDRLRSRAPGAPLDLLRQHAAGLTRPLSGGGLTWKRDRNVVDHYDRPDAWSHLPRISVPTLIVRGAESTLLRADVARRMRDAIPNCTLVELEGGGHWAHHESPDAFQQAVEAFLEQHP